MSHVEGSSPGVQRRAGQVGAVAVSGGGVSSPKGSFKGFF